MKADKYFVPSEHQSQCAVFEWADIQAGAYPELKLLYAIPNGGARDARTGKMLQREGVKKGVPDFCLPVPRGGFHGLYVEMKKPGGRTSPEQREWLQALAGQGYATAVCHGFDHAQTMVMRYLREEWRREGE